MAGRRQQQLAAKHAAHRLFVPRTDFSASAHEADEFDESDVWGYAVDPHQDEFSKPAAAPAPSHRPSAAWSKGGDPERVDRTAEPASSLPINIPDWSKILGDFYGGGNSASRGRWGDEVDDDEEGSTAVKVIPPHELLCRSRAASFSVHEGIGRTLKGRDLSRVRNAVWEKIGFQD